VPDVATPLDQRPLGGMGLFLMREVMDQVSFQFEGENGNRLTMVKQLPRRE
jgi:anti-sigma regulatory factor (Ser/Thr protein kinase)